MQFTARYNHHVDRGPWHRVSELFTADGVLDLGKVRLEGRDQIDEFYRERSARAIVSRHVSSDVVVEPGDGDHRARVISTLTLFRELGGTVPVMVGEYYDEVVRDAPRVWRFSERRLTVVVRAD